MYVLKPDSVLSHSYRSSLCGVSWFRGDTRMQCAFEMQGETAMFQVEVENSPEVKIKEFQNLILCAKVAFLSVTVWSEPSDPVPPAILCSSPCRLETSKPRLRSPGLRIVWRFWRAMRRQSKSALKMGCWPSILPRSAVDTFSDGAF